MRQSKLMDVAKALERTRIEDFSLVGVETSKNMNCISYLVQFFVISVHQAVPNCRITVSVLSGLILGLGYRRNLSILSILPLPYH